MNEEKSAFAKIESSVEEGERKVKAWREEQPEWQVYQQRKKLLEEKEQSLGMAPDLNQEDDLIGPKTTQAIRTAASNAGLLTEES